MLDAVGDLALAGLPLIARYKSFRGGHKMNVSVLEALFADRSAFAVIDAQPRREAARAEAGFGLRPAMYSEAN